MLVELKIFSPRWGREDTYRIKLERDFMEITMQVRKSRVTWSDTADPIWSGETLQRTMTNDSIFPLAATQDLFERAWKSWRDGEISDQQVEAELKLLADWLNSITKAKPRSDFWSKYI